MLMGDGMRGSGEAYMWLWRIYLVVWTVESIKMSVVNGVIKLLRCLESKWGNVRIKWGWGK